MGVLYGCMSGGAAGAGAAVLRDHDPRPRHRLRHLQHPARGQVRRVRQRPQQVQRMIGSIASYCITVHNTLSSATLQYRVYIYWRRYLYDLYPHHTTPLLLAGQARLLGPHLRRLPLLLGEARLLRALQLPSPLLRSLSII